MLKSIGNSWVFLILSLVCGFLAFHHPFAKESLLLGLIYASAFSLRFPKDLSVRELFPVLMIFLFLIVLSEVPFQSFSLLLLFTTRALILFRGLLISAMRLKKQGTWKIGLSLELILSVVLVYSRFKPVPSLVLEYGQNTLGSILIIFASAFTPYWVPGMLLGAISLSPSYRIWGIMGFGIIAAYESNLAKRT